MTQKNLKKKIVNTKPKTTQATKIQAKQAATKKTVKGASKSTSVKHTSKVIAAVASSKKPPAKVAPAKVSMPAKPTIAATPVARQADKKPAAKVASLKMLYKVGNYVVYPTHGVGKIMAEETQMIGDIELRMLVISFEKDKMTLRVPLSRASAAGLRPVSSAEQMKRVFVTLKSRARTSRGMWSRRAQEYETKINSGNIHFIAEVVRDLHQNVDQSERSYSERMIYESALARLVGELAACEGTDYKTATDKLMKLLRAKVAAAAAEALKEAA